MATKPDYYIITVKTGPGAFSWRWEIKRRSSPMGVKLGASGYQTQAAAEHAGREALGAFLEEIAREAQRK